MKEIVYILKNPLMPSVIKIGKTDRADISKRLKELFTTESPVPFDCIYAAEVKNNEETEKVLHEKFKEDRVNPRREFFWTDAEIAIRELKKYEIANLTPNVRNKVDGKLSEAEKKARWEAREKIEKKYPEYKNLKEIYKK
jgi:hypothetical protein